MKTTSVKSYPTAINHDLTNGNFPLPSEMVEMLESATVVPDNADIPMYAIDAYKVTTARLPKATSNWCRLSFAAVDPMRSIARPMTTSERLQLTALRTPASPKGIVARLIAAQQEACTESTDDPEVRTPRPWPLTADELKSTIYSTLNDLHGLEAWKKEQAKVRAAQSSTFRINTEKITRPDGKREWDNAIVRQFPPLTVARAKDGTVLPSEGVVHVPARYVVQLPGEKMVDLGKTQGKWKPVLHSAPDAALRAVATRLGMSIKGGAASIVAAIWNKTDIVPTYQTIWKDSPWLDTTDANGLVTNNGWLVIVGYERNRTIAPSHYLANEDGDLIHATEELELTPVQVENFTERLTVSKSEYRILSRANIATADGEGIMDDEGNINVDEYMELDAELIDQGFQRDGERCEVDTDLITGGMLLVEEAALILDGRGVTDSLNDFRAGAPIWQHPDFRDALAELARNVRRENHELSHQIMGLKGPISQAMMDAFNSPEKSLAHQEAAGRVRELQKRRDALIARQTGNERVRDFTAMDEDEKLIEGGKLKSRRFIRLYRNWFEDRANLEAQTLLPRNYGHWAGRFDANGSPILENPVKITHKPQIGFQTTRPGLDPKSPGYIPSPSRHEHDYPTSWLGLDPAVNAPIHPESSHKIILADTVAPGRVIELFASPRATRTTERPTALTQAQQDDHAERLAIRHAKRVNLMKGKAQRLVSMKNRAIQERDWQNCLANAANPKDSASNGRKWTLNSDQALRFW